MIKGEELSVYEKEYMKTYERYITAFEEALNKVIENYKDHELFVDFKNCIRGGKRLRPILLLMSNEVCGGGKEDIMPAAVAIELLHTVSLIHDDIIDEELNRRGRAPLYISSGLKSAILSADYAFSIILDLSSRYRDSEVARILAKAASEMSSGELKELKIIEKRKAISLKEYLEIISLKTASLFKAATYLGALLSRNAEKYAKELEAFGYNLGMAYQIRDDLKDLDKEKELTSLLNVDNKAKVLIDEMKKYIRQALEKLDKIPQCPTILLLKKLVTDLVAFI